MIHLQSKCKHRKLLDHYCPSKVGRPIVADILFVTDRSPLPAGQELDGAESRRSNCYAGAFTFSAACARPSLILSPAPRT